MTSQEIETNLKTVRDCIEMQVGTDDIAGALEKLNKLIILQGLQADNHSKAKKAYLEAQVKVLDDLAGGDMRASIMMKAIEAHCAEQSMQFTYAERLSAGLSNAIEGMRSVVSTMKTEMMQSKYGQ